MKTEVTNVTGIHKGVGTDEFARTVADFADAFDEGAVGTVEIVYEKNGMSLTCTGSVSRVRDDRDRGVSSIDMWVSASNSREAYLHVNPETGDYYFNDASREQEPRLVTGFTYW